MATSDPCLRCGDFVREPAVEGLALCRECVAPAEAPPGAISVVPPKELWLAQLWPTLVLVAASMAAGAWLAVTRSGAPTPLAAVLLGLGGAVVALLAGGVPAFFVTVPFMGNVGLVRIKPRMFERVGLAPDAPCAFVYLVDTRLPPLRSAILPEEPGDIGALVVQREGLAFLGVRGTRFSIAASEIVATRVEWLFASYPFRSALAIQLRDGRRRWIAFLDGGSYSANKAAARAALELLARP